MEIAHLDHLHGGNVLVKSAQDRHDPPIALRGTLDTLSTPGVVKVALEYPDMCVTPARHAVINLDARGIAQLLASEREGVYEVTVPQSLEPIPPPETPQAAS